VTAKYGISVSYPLNKYLMSLGDTIEDVVGSDCFDSDENFTWNRKMWWNFDSQEEAAQAVERLKETFAAYDGIEVELTTIHYLYVDCQACGTTNEIYALDLSALPNSPNYIPTSEWRCEKCVAWLDDNLARHEVAPINSEYYQEQTQPGPCGPQEGGDRVGQIET
jgi:hypothetical protein